MKTIQLILLLTFCHVLGIAQCDSGEVEIEIVVHTDAYGYEGYWELTPNGDDCSTNTIASGGNTAVGCDGAGAQDQTPGGYGNNEEITEGPWCLSEAESYDIHFIDDWGDGGFSFDVLVNGFNTVSFAGIGLGGTYTFVAQEPAQYDLTVFGSNLYSYVELGSVPLEAHVFNAGTEIITGYNLNYSVNGGTVNTHVVTGSDMANYESEDIEHSIPLELSTFGVYTIDIWASSLNGSFDDEITSNDTLTKVIEAGPGIPNILDDYIGATFTLDEVANGSQQVNRPTDLDFHPVLTNKELWITNKGTEDSGGSTVTIYDAGQTGQTSEYKQDGNAWHFMSLPTGLAFSQNGNFATSPGVYDANHNGGDAFTGPSLWSSDMSIYGEPSGGNGSHLDMLHASPRCQGIAAEVDNVFWVFDGETNDIVRYDFHEDHGPGNDFHGDAIIRRYSDDAVARDPNEQIVSHLVLDKNLEWLYVVDHGNGRVIRIDINTGSDEGGTPNYNNPEAVVEYTEYTGYTQELVIDGLTKPAGIDVVEDRMIISDYETGEISIYDITSMPAQLLDIISTGLSSVQGVKIGPDGRIWFVDYDTDGVYVITAGPLSVSENSIDLGLFPNPTSDKVRIRISGDEKIVSVRLFDAQGKSVMFNSNVNSQLEIDLQNMPAGMYEVKVVTENGVGVERLIKN